MIILAYWKDFQFYKLVAQSNKIRKTDSWTATRGIDSWTDSIRGITCDSYRYVSIGGRQQRRKEDRVIKENTDLNTEMGI